jgi:pyruvate-ferredoxin/flavodoxin oxidoreductase
VQAFLEAESYDGPSLIIAYSHCIAHGYDMAQGVAQQKRAVDSGVWPLYRFDPRRIALGEPPLRLDYGPPKSKVADYMGNESRFRTIERADPERYKGYVTDAQAAADRRYSVYKQLAGIAVPAPEAAAEAVLAPAPAKGATEPGKENA